MSSTAKAPPRASATAGVLILSLLWAAAALRADLMPNLLPVALPPLERQAIPLALLAIAALAAASVYRAGWPLRREASHFFARAFSIALGLFLLPAGLSYLARAWVPPLARTALFTLVPLFAVVMEPYIGDPRQRQPAKPLAAALILMVGALLVFPVQFPDSLASAAVFAEVILAAAAVAWANCRAVLAMSEASGKSSLPFVAMVAGSGAAALAATSVFLEQPSLRWDALKLDLLWSAMVELPALALLFWLMRRTSATRMATRYAFAPLLSIVIGVLLLQSVSEIRLRTWLGLALISAGAGWLLLAPEDNNADPEASPLHLIPK